MEENTVAPAESSEEVVESSGVVEEPQTVEPAEEATA